MIVTRYWQIGFLIVSLVELILLATGQSTHANIEREYTFNLISDFKDEMHRLKEIFQTAMDHTVRYNTHKFILFNEYIPLSTHYFKYIHDGKITPDADVQEKINQLQTIIEQINKQTNIKEGYWPTRPEDHGHTISGYGELAVIYSQMSPSEIITLVDWIKRRM